MRYEDLPRDEKNGAVLPEQVEFPIRFRLLRPVAKDGVDCAEIDMREPTVLDLETAHREKSDMGRTVALLSHLLALTPDEVRRLGTRDFSRLGEVVAAFL